jgi:alanine racemase
MLNVSEIVDVKEGTVVTVFGRDKDFIPVEEFADLSGTINYETVCLIGKRVPRIFKSGGQVVGKLNYLEINGGANGV